MEAEMDTYIKRSPPALRGRPCVSFQAHVLSQRPWSLKVLRSILAIPRTAHLWTEISNIVPVIYVPVTAMRALITFFLLPNIAITWDCNIYHYCLLILLVDHHDFPLISQYHLNSLDLEVPQDHSLVIFNHLWSCFPL